MTTSTKQKQIFIIFPGCDYFIANWIRGFNGPNEFIAAPGLSTATIPHFWQMILENNVQLIVKLSEVRKTGDSSNNFRQMYSANILT
jgi:protein tyrosine phosphatase